MNLLNKLEKQFGDYIPTNLTKYIIFGQLGVFFFLAAYPDFMSIFTLQGSRVLEGQWWRLITYIFRPITFDILFGAFVYYIFYLYGTALERTWGTFKYFMYLFISFIATAALAFIFPEAKFTNAYMYTSIFLAFAWLFPDFTIMLFFVLPVKIKWLALIAWAGILVAFLGSNLASRAHIFLSLLNFFLYFWEDILIAAKINTKTMKPGGILKQPRRDPYHVCFVCKTNELDNPKMQIRYCDVCKPTTCYCGDHIAGHTHRA